MAVLEAEKVYFDFLDGLRESRVTNMFGATPYLLEAFPDLEKEEGFEILNNWMKTFKKK